MHVAARSSWGRPTGRAETAKATAVVEALGLASRQRHDRGVGGEGDRIVERAGHDAVERRSRPVRGDDDTTGAVAVDGGYHRPRIGRVREARSGRSGEAEAVDELAAELALPVDVGTGGHASEPDGGDDLAARDDLAGTHEDVARVVVAGLKTLGVLHADAQPADRDPAGRG